jgi:MYXO-CTERM domain-containing protein
MTVAGVPGRRVVVDTPAVRATPRAQVSQTLYLERCTGGCVLQMGANDARANSTMLLQVARATVAEFATRQGRVGADADAEWGRIVQCMKDVYSPYDVVVTDVKPGADTGYHKAIIAGEPEDVGRSSDILGLAPLASDCSAIDNVISLTFANAHASPNVTARVQSICWTAAQESAHAFGLDHEYAFLDGNRSACTDPMTYRTDCGGEKFFRDEAASCGENVVRACRCGNSQNSHAKLLSVFGPGTPITRKPTAMLVAPVADDDLLGTEVVAMAGAQRGVARVELHFNGFKWAEAPGTAFGPSGQPDPSMYKIAVPLDLPDGIIDVQVVAVDDLGAATTSELVTVTRGDPCTTAATCATGQRCDAGRCLWDAPAGELGERCTYPQFCKTGVCDGEVDDQICTQRCRPDDADACPAGLACVAAGETSDICVPVASGGCCRVDRGDPGWAYFGIGAAVLAFAIRKRRR